VEGINVIRLSYLLASVGVAGLALMLVFSSSAILFTFNWQISPKPMLGIVYFYDREDPLTIVSDLQRMKDDGFQIISIPFVWDDNPKSAVRIKTNVLYEWAERLGLKIYLRQPYSDEALLKYLSFYHVDYLQIINEADAWLLKTSTVPGEIIAMAQKNAETAKSINPNIKTVSTYAVPFTLPSLITGTAEHADIVGIDIYEKIQLDTFPIQMQTLLTMTGKENIWIGEFGRATLNDEEQADFLIEGLNLFAKNGVEAVIIWSWNHCEALSIKGRLAEQKIAEWTKT